jgi:hypothetical protein
LGDEKPIPLVAGLLRAIWTRRSVLHFLARVSRPTIYGRYARILGAAAHG